MRMLALVTVAGLAAAAAALTASATPPGVDGVVLFSQPRCPAWAARRCDFLPQPCAVDPALDTSFVPNLADGAVLSPDGRSVAWIADSDLVVQQGDELRRVAKVEGGTALPAWSPDGTQIAANGFTLANPAPLEAFDVATGTARNLTTGVFDPSWSPDGSEVAAAVPDGIVAVPAAGGPLRRIVSDSGTGNVGDQAPDWSPDSSFLAFTHLAGLEPSTVQLVRRDGSERRDLAQGSMPSWDPLGYQIAFVRDMPDGEGQIRVVELDGSGERLLSATPFVRDTRPRWLNDRQSAALVFLGGCDTVVASDGELVEAGDGIDTIFVTGSRADVHGNGGDDLVWTGSASYGGGVPETLDGGPGDDDFELYAGRNTVLGGPGSDRVDALFTTLPQNVDGGAGQDWIRGGVGDDAIAGGDGNDALYGYGGANTIHGGAGNDLVAAVSSASPQRLFGDAGNDVVKGGRGADRLDGGPGNDTIEARDGRRDVVVCGPGRDTAVVDRRDVVGRGCERVLRPR